MLLKARINVSTDDRNTEKKIGFLLERAAKQIFDRKAKYKDKIV